MSLVQRGGKNLQVKNQIKTENGFKDRAESKLFNLYEKMGMRSTRCLFTGQSVIKCPVGRGPSDAPPVEEK